MTLTQGYKRIHGARRFRWHRVGRRALLVLLMSAAAVTMGPGGAPAEPRLCGPPNACGPPPIPQLFIVPSVDYATPGQRVDFGAGGGPFPRGVQFAWHIDGASPTDGVGRSISATFAAAGHFRVTLRAMPFVPAMATYVFPVRINPTPCPKTNPFDLSYGALDANGLPLNPEWGWQCAYAGPPDPSSYPNPTAWCNGFAYKANHTALDDAGCSAQVTGWDVPQGGLYYQICHARDSFPYVPIEPDTYVHGHVNWTPVTYTGTVSFHDISTGWFQDYDSNLLLRPDTSSAPQVDAPSTPGLTPANSDGAIQLEFYNDELALAFGAPRDLQSRGRDWAAWLSQLTHLTSARAVVTGLLGLDNRHDSKTELHPVYALAAELGVTPTGADRWLVLFRNTGGEGGCSRHEASAHPLRTTGNRVTVSIPAPAGPVGGFVLGPHSDLHGFHVSAGTGAPLTAGLSPDGRHANITASLPAPASFAAGASGAFGESVSSGAILAGTVDLYWLTAPAPSGLTPAVRALSPLRRVSGIRLGRPIDGPEALLATLAKLLTPTQSAKDYSRSVLYATAPAARNPAYVHASGCRSLGSAATRALRTHALRKQATIVRSLLHCAG